MNIDVQSFLDMLPYMGKGMVGIFIVTAILMIMIAVFNRVFSKTE